MKIFLKPIQFTNFKEEIIITIQPENRTIDLISEILKLNPDFGRSLDFMFRGKKLVNDKTLEEQGVKDGTKLMLYGSENKTQILTKEQVSILNKENAKITLTNLGFKPDMVESVIKTIPNVETLNTELIVEKSLIFLKSLTKETISEYSIEIEESNSVFIIDEEKITTIFAMGDGIQGQLGIGKYIKSDFPMRVNKLRNVKIRKISCGVYHTTALTQNGQVYFWGRYYMPLTIDNFTNKTDFKTGDSPYPILIESLTNELIVEIGCGSNHSLALNDRGEIFTWGEGIYGQLGHGLLDNEFYPRKIENVQNFKFRNVAGGATHSIAITHDGYTFGWGSNEKNQLNLKQTKSSNVPLILPLYELIGNYTIDEIRNLNLDGNFTKNIKIKNIPDIDSLVLLGKDQNFDQNDFSHNIEDLMKIKFIDCGTWFTVCNSRMFPNTLYLFGNSFKKVIKITYFEENKLEIKQISASNYNICVLTHDNSVFKININNLPSSVSGKEAEELKHIPDNVEIEKIGCGYSCLVMLTKDKQAILNQNFEPNNFMFLNSEIKSNINDFSTGPSHMFLISSLNDHSFGNFLFEKIQKYFNSNSLEGLNPDMYIKGNNSQSNFMFPCHSFFIEQFIKLDNKNNEGVINLNLTNDNILILLEIIYTCNLKFLFNEESKTIVENSEMLQNLHFNLKEILVYFNSFAKTVEKDLNSTTRDLLIQLINFYSDKILEILNYDRYTKDYEVFMVNKKFTETCNLVLDNVISGNITNSNNDRNNLNINQEEPHDDEDEFNQRINNNINYFEKFENRGTQVDILSTQGINHEFDKNKITLDDYIKSQKRLEDYRYKFYFKIIETKDKLNKSKIEYLQKNTNNNLTIKVNMNNVNINKLMLGFKSIYFNNLIKLNKNNSKIENSEFWDLNNLEINFSPISLQNTLKFLNSETFKINLEEIFELLEIASYLMIDNLLSLIEIDLEGIISKYTNYLFF